MSYLYVCDQGAVINSDQGYFVVKQKDGMLKKVPKETLEAIAIFGNIQMTTQCTKECLERGIPVSYYALNGAYFGRLHSTRHVNIFRQKKQFANSENEEFCLGFAKNVLKAKIHNQRVVLKRYERSSSEDLQEECKNIKIAENKLQNSSSIEEIMGYEGNASRNYFKGVSKIVKEDFKFNGRNRQPPKDPFNSMISLGYSLLMQEIYGELESHGLHPYAGFIHKDKERHPTLVSDLVEEWRAVIVDSVVLSLIQGNEIKIENFDMDWNTGGVFIKKEGMKVFIQKFEKKLASEMGYLDYVNARTSFRRAIWLQIRELVKAIETEDYSLYHPMTIR